jgi:alpha-1,2-mannosyltransferase
VASVTVADSRPDDLSRWRTSRWVQFATVAVLAFVVRLLPVLAGGGLGFYGRYDDGVYYAAADALTFGRLPYRNYVFVQPPGLPLVLTPFALLGRLASDPVGMATGRLAFMALGAANAVLVCALAGRWGGRPAMAAGLLYACWLPAVYSEQSTFIEPLGTTALLVTLLLLLGQVRPRVPRAEVLAGVALGLACTLKIWYAAPLAIVLVCLLAERQRHAALRVAAGSVAALVVVLLPFFVTAPRQMWDMVVRDQLARSQPSVPVLSRLTSIVGVHSFFRNSHAIEDLTTAVILTLLTVAAVACWTDRRARMIVVVLIGNFAVVLASPEYYVHYAALTAAPAAIVLTVGLRIGAGKLTRLNWNWRARTSVWVLSLAIILASGIRIATAPTGQAFPGATFGNAAPAGCITADDPQALIQMNRLSRDLRDDCRVVIDVTAITYGSLPDTNPNGQAIPRSSDLAFQHYLYHYLTSAAAFVVARPGGDDSPPAISRALEQWRVLARSHHLTLRRGISFAPRSRQK